MLVKVNGDIITKTELEERQIGALRERKVSPEVLKNDEQLKKALAEVTPQLLVDAIDELLVIQLGREKGLRLSDEQFNRWLTSMRKDQNLEDDKRFEAALKQEGMTISDIRRNVEKQFLLQQVQTEEFGGKLQITEEEARQYYQANQKEFVEPATVTLREILIEVPTVTQQGRAMVTVGKDDEAAKKAEAVRARLTAGEDFAKVASEVSASASKANGGLIGPIATSELAPDLQKMLENDEAGRDHAADARRQGLPDPQARDLEAVGRPAVRLRPRPRRRSRLPGAVAQPRCASSSSACGARRSSCGRTKSCARRTSSRSPR